MRTIQTGLIAIAFTFSLHIVPATWAADTHDKAGDHFMIEPNDLKWADVPTLPPGAKVAVIEGPPNEAVPFMMRLKFPADYKIPVHWLRPLSISRCCRGPSIWVSAISWM